MVLAADLCTHIRDSGASTEARGPRPGPRINGGHHSEGQVCRCLVRARAGKHLGVLPSVGIIEFISGGMGSEDMASPKWPSFLLKSAGTFLPGAGRKPPALFVQPAEQ